MCTGSWKRDFVSCTDRLVFTWIDLASSSQQILGRTGTVSSCSGTFTVCLDSFGSSPNPDQAPNSRSKFRRRRQASRLQALIISAGFKVRFCRETCLVF